MRRFRLVRGTVAVLVATGAGVALLAGPSAAATSRIITVGAAAPADADAAAIYDYEFADTAGTVANAAPAGPVAPMTLAGDWSPSSDGVDLTGDTSGDYAVGYANPASGSTLNAAASAAVGFGAQFGYSAPSTGVCFGDTPNITQIGRFAANSAQAKLQLSKCADNKNHVVVECRFAGALTPATVYPVSSTLSLIDGDTYNASCQKLPDAGGQTTVTLTVADLGPSGAKTISNSFTVGALGPMKTTEYLSAGNKYPVPAPANNTDQFVGDLVRSVFCTGAVADVNACLASYLPPQ